jgi:hypothetical protein
MTDDERAIRNVVETWMAASKSGDIATVLTLMTEDVVFMVPGQEPFGKEALPPPRTVLARCGWRAQARSWNCRCSASGHSLAITSR